MNQLRNVVESIHTCTAMHNENFSKNRQTGSWYLKSAHTLQFITVKLVAKYEEIHAILQIHIEVCDTNI